MTEAAADDFSRWLATDARVRGESSRKPKGLSPATLGKRLSWAATIWRDAVRRELTTRNPFDSVKKPSGVNPDRQAYVPRETIQQLIDAESDSNGGRSSPCPGSWVSGCRANRFRWSGRYRLAEAANSYSVSKNGVSWEIVSDGSDPSEILPHLEALYAAAPEGAVHIFARLRDRESHKAAVKGFWSAFNLRTALQKKAGQERVVPWPKLWHALRASAETDLARQFSLASVTAWLGNSPKGGGDELPDGDGRGLRFGIRQRNAKCNAHGAETGGKGGLQSQRNAKTPDFSGVSHQSVAGAGFEPTTSRL